MHSHLMEVGSLAKKVGNRKWKPLGLNRMLCCPFDLPAVDLEKPGRRNTRMGSSQECERQARQSLRASFGGQPRSRKRESRERDAIPVSLVGKGERSASKSL